MKPTELCSGDLRAVPTAGIDSYPKIRTLDEIAAARISEVVHFHQEQPFIMLQKIAMGTTVIDILMSAHLPSSAGDYAAFVENHRVAKRR